MKKRTILIEYKEAEAIDELETSDATLVRAAREASGKAWAPYSHFSVGAAVRLDNGTIVTGCNQENSAYPSGLCAERVALFSANAQYPENAVIAIAISAQLETPIKPCGACLQVISESETRYKKPIRLLLDGKSSTLIINGVSQMLPFRF